jgi:hypothetical protein
MDDLFLTVTESNKQRAGTDFTTIEYEISAGIRGRLLAFYCEDTVSVRTVREWVIKWRDIGGIDINIY